jgi:hypothetical protein
MIWIGVGIIVVIAVVIGLRALTRAPGFPPGTRAFEAELVLGPLTAAVKERRLRYEAETDPVKKAKLEKQLAFLGKQLQDNLAIVQARDLSPGKGYVGFEPPPED